MRGTGPYVALSSEREIFARLGVAWCEPRDREGKFSLLHPLSGRPWFEGGLPTGTALQPLQLQALRELHPSLPLPTGWKCATCRAVFRECRCPQTRAHGHLNPNLTLTRTLTSTQP